MDSAVSHIVGLFHSHGNGSYGVEPVSQLQHALQSATLAEKEGAPAVLIVAALLHDMGHFFEGEDPLQARDLAENLDDAHEHRAQAWLLQHFGAEVADPIRLHVRAKRYLCTKDPRYAEQLSPTSHKSFLDQGGLMSKEELSQFEEEPHFEAALTLRRWDDLAKDADRQTPSLEHFVPLMERCLVGGG